MKYCFILAMSQLLSACSLFAPIPVQQAAPPMKAAPTLSPVTGQARGWWNVHFTIDWPKETEVSWYVDVYLAKKVVEPVLRENQKDMDLWRFHRRAARDAAGHQFSFVFYSSPAVAEKVYQALRDEDALNRVIDKGLVTRVIYQDTHVNSEPMIKDNSDKSWSLPVQRSWPYFIMGVSDMWLRLIDELVKQNAGDASINDFDDELTFYQDINTKLDATWRDEGGHAYLHHLNALFGYQETQVIVQKLLRF